MRNLLTNWAGTALLLCGLAMTAQAETGVQGQVLHAQTGAPIAGVQVSVLPGTHVACTDAQGRYRLSGVPVPSHGLTHVAFRRAGYGISIIPLTLSANRLQSGDALLLPAPAAEASRVSTCAPRRNNAGFAHAWIYGRVVDFRTGNPVRSGQVVVARGDARWSGRLDADGFYGIDIGNGGPPQGGHATVQLVGSSLPPITVFALPGFHTVADMFGDGRSDTRRANPQARPQTPRASRAPRERARPQARPR